MSKSKGTHAPFAGLWLIAFLVLKIGGSALAAWSWWWLLLPIVPVLVVIFQRLGML